MFYSQCGEDKQIYEKYFLNKQGGVFLELGAMDGIIYSNTKFFEDALGWSGVLIEPHPLLNRHITSNRPKSKVYPCAISSSPGYVTMSINPNAPAVSAVTDTLVDSFKNIWHSKSYTHEVPCTTLGHILQDAKITHIDFFSLDVEGHEYEVLQSMDWSIPVHVLLLETLSDYKVLNEKCREFLRTKGFVFDGLCAHNELWINPSYPSLHE